ncbi:pentatricopeptide repeat-containing protein At1g80270, mitochondrial [Sesamum indicum]|uniref:Pentatricopeptide repeat-containing protein At1g80270, mitochondrial n=1 Tax=Sesamum indicum TaxID=4182 RepID=A0A6I9T5C3_SESIN|nr:pentatricopeptide repeat-containing protein At1g80270, mitochondrial [Sesamum indicum]
MWALRRTSIHLKNRGLSSGTIGISCMKSEIARSCLENHNAGVVEPQGKLLDESLYLTRFYNTSSSYSKSYAGARTFSSQADAKSSREGDDDLEDAFSELETPLDAVQGAASGDEIDDESDLSEGEGVADDMQNELGKVGTDTDVGEKRSPKGKAISALTKAILAAPLSSVSKALDKWVEEGNEVTQTEVSLTMLHLRKRRMFVKALQLSEWLESTKHIEFHETYYASRVDLISKVRGIFKAEEYIQKIPESCRGEIVYRTLLANCVSATNVRKSEEVFNKMKSLFPVTCFSCNQLLLLYKRTDKKKIADVLLLMEKENIKPSIFTYQILIDVKGQSNDIGGMEQIVETMKSEGVEPNIQIQASLARHYTAAGLKDKAEAILKEMEGDDITKNRWVCRVLLPIYASLGRDDEVERIWKVCESNPFMEECMAAIGAWGKLKRIEEAEAAFDKMVKKVKRPSSKHFALLLNVYANHKMLAKGKDLVKRLAESSSTVGPLTWDALVKLYVGAGEVEKADSILDKALKQKRGKPLFNSYFVILDQYAKRGDIHNAEKIFLRMRDAGYVSRVRPYQALLAAYINAKAPAYGFRERMKADSVIPNKAMNDLLDRADAFRKSAVAELLE